MKKFISMVMAAAMVVSLVPATAFAKVDGEVEASAKVVKAADIAKGTDVAIAKENAPELQVKVKNVDWKETNDDKDLTSFTVTLDNAEFDLSNDFASLVNVVCDVEKDANGTYNGAVVKALVQDVEVSEDADQIDFTIKHKWHEDDLLSIDLASVLTKKSAGTKATVSIESDDIVISNGDDLVYATIVDKAIKASIKKTVDVAEDEVTTLYSGGLKIEPAVGDNFAGIFDSTKDNEITLKLSKGFEFVKSTLDFEASKAANVPTPKVVWDDNEVTITVGSKIAAAESLVIKNLQIEATSAKAGDVATITVGGTNVDSVKVEVAKVVDYKVVLSVDEDEDVPVIYSGVNVKNDGITDDSDHVSLEVTAEETFPGAWSMRKGFSFELPEGVYVTAVDVTDTEGLTINEDEVEVDTDIVEARFFDAYQEGDHMNFEFGKRVFDDVDVTLNTKCAMMQFTLTLVADPTFEGDVVLKLTGDLVDEQEVTIAKFVKPYTVKAEQNDLKIDYRYTEIPTAITITEAEAGLWAKGSKNEPAAKFWFTVDRGDVINFEDDAVFEVSEDSELEIDDFTTKDAGKIGFTVDEESDEAATVTIKDMSLFMQRNIPAGPYDLTIGSSLADAYEAQLLYAPDHQTVTVTPDADFVVTYSTLNHKAYNTDAHNNSDKDCYVGDVCDYSDTVKEAWINVITAGREVDDASFTTKVVVPVGESYIVAGENQVALDVPAYINAAGYTMLPVRAVAVALGINTNNVLWDAATKTVTILYGQRIITMAAGQKVVYVNGSAIPASAAVEIVDGRTFLPMRDLATALGVTDITWDAATKTATLNGNQK